MPLPNSFPWLESVDAKMIRAHEHLETLAREVDGYLGTISLQTYLKSAPDRPTPWLVVHGNDYIPPIRLSVIAGDCIHNMRSALDNLVCGLALTQDRTCDCKDTKFPFTENEPDWIANSPKRLAGIPEEAVQILRTLQPWCDPVSPNPLLMMNKLNNMDKHRHCAFGLGWSQDTVFRVHYLPGRVVGEALNPLLDRYTRRLKHSGNYKYTFAFSKAAAHSLPPALPYPKLDPLFYYTRMAHQ